MQTTYDRVEMEWMEKMVFQARQDHMEPPDLLDQLVLLEILDHPYVTCTIIIYNFIYIVYSTFVRLYIIISFLLVFLLLGRSWQSRRAGPEGTAWRKGQ